jgi:hypothetical protein
VALVLTAAFVAQPGPGQVEGKGDKGECH